jgi:cell division protein FtsL
MNGFAGFMGRTLRGVRLVEFGAVIVLLAMATGVYLAKASAGRERAEIATVERQIGEEKTRIRLLQAEVAHLEEPERLERLSTEIGLGPTDAKHEGAPDDLARIARAALPPGKAEKKSPTLVAEARSAATSGAPQ